MCIRDSTISNDTIERIVRNPDAEHAFCERLLSFGFHVVDDTASPLHAVPAALEMASPSDWIQFSREHLADLENDGWKIEKSADYRYNLQAIQKWYASINESDDTLDEDWFSLEIGIVVNKKHFSLFPLLQPLIRKYPESFE